MTTTAETRAEADALEADTNANSIQFIEGKLKAVCKRMRTNADKRLLLKFVRLAAEWEQKVMKG